MILGPRGGGGPRLQPLVPLWARVTQSLQGASSVCPLLRGEPALLSAPAALPRDCGAKRTGGVAKPGSRGSAARSGPCGGQPPAGVNAFPPLGSARVPAAVCGPVCLPRSCGAQDAGGETCPAGSRHAGASTHGAVLVRRWSLGPWHENAVQVRSPARSALENQPGWAGLWSESPDPSPQHTPQIFTVKHFQSAFLSGKNQQAGGPRLCQ